MAIGSDGREAISFWYQVAGQRNHLGELIHSEIWNTLKHYGVTDDEELIELFEAICLVDDLYKELHNVQPAERLNTEEQ